MLTFLDLPREIRDMIYELALVSPSGQIVPKIQKSMTITKFKRSPGRSSSKRPSNLALAFHPSDPTTTSKYPLHIQPTAPPLAIFLPATHPQIYIETSQLLWAKNTLVFHKPSTALDVLKHMGQTPSRLIKRVHLHVIPLETCDRLLGKALCMLASRARSGQLREVRLVVHRESRQFCTCGKKGVGCRALCQHHMTIDIETWMRALEAVLEKNRDVKWGNVKRWIHVQGPGLLETWGTYLARDWMAKLVLGPSKESDCDGAFPS